MEVNHTLVRKCWCYVFFPCFEHKPKYFTKACFKCAYKALCGQANGKAVCVVCLFKPEYVPADEHLGCFHILATVNNVAMNIGVHVSFQINVFVLFGHI